MVKWEVALIGISIIIGYFFASWFISRLLGIEEFSSPTAYTLVIAAGVLIAISAFVSTFNYNLGRIMRIIAYLFLFIFLLIIEGAILKPYVKRTDINIINCTNVFFPSKTSNNIVYDSLAYASCIFAGYVPENQTEIGWITFILFYILLPFAFIWAFVHGLMKDIMGNWFKQTPQVIPILSFITAIYAARTMLGGFLLTFLGYGAWGLAGIFIAVFLVKGLERIIEDMFGIEKYSSELRIFYKTQDEIKAEFARIALQVVDKAQYATTEGAMRSICMELSSLRNSSLWNALLPEIRVEIDLLITGICSAASAGNFKEFHDRIAALKGILNNWTK
jgi:hypothetical protein